MPFGEGSAAMGFQVEEIKRRSRAVKVTHPPAERRQLHKRSDSGLSQSNADWKSSNARHKPLLRSGFTSAMKRQRNETTSQARLPGIHEDVKKTFGFEWRATDAAWREALRLRSPFLPAAKMGFFDGLWQKYAENHKNLKDGIEKDWNCTYCLIAKKKQ